MELYEKIGAAIRDYPEVFSLATQDACVIEECSEVTKALCKRRRGKGDAQNVIDEAVDAITTLYILLNLMDVSSGEIESYSLKKIYRACLRFEESREL